MTDTQVRTHPTLVSLRACTACLILSLAAALCAAAASPPTVAHLTAKQIVANNVKARGGLEAWRKIETMVCIGQLETGNPSAPRVPFVLQQARPDKTRFEVHVHDKTSVRVFNGLQGWKLHQSHSGAPELVPYTADEIAALFEARHGCVVRQIYSKSNASAPAPARLLAQAVGEVDFLITGLGD